MARSTSHWVTVAEKSALDPNSVIGVTIGALDIAIYHVDGQLYATDDICPHADGYLHHGWLKGGVIECPLHGARFEVKTGRGVDGPYECDLKKFAVRISGEDIQVEIPSDPSEDSV